jgi:DNA-binding MarR family transcriptional regulator
MLAMSDMAEASSTRFLNDLEMSAWRTYIETHYDLISAIEADLAPTGLSIGDYQVLVTLSEAEEHRMRMCDLAAILQLTPSGATRRLDGLVRSGWVDRLNSTVDRRVMLAVLTPAGWDKLHEALHPHVNSVRRHLIDLLDENELRAMASIFTKVRDALEAG